MKIPSSIIVVTLLFISHISFSQSHEEKMLQLLEDFEANVQSLKFDVLDWNDPDDDYGLQYTSLDGSYRVFDIHQFREKSETSFKYLTEKNLKILIVKVVRLEYEKKGMNLIIPQKSIQTMLYIMELLSEDLMVKDTKSMIPRMKY